MIELVSPNLKGVLKIKNPKVPIASDALRFAELKHIEDTITGMQTMPDFGYDGDNFVIERSQDAPKNWKLLTDFVYNKDKYEWLQNHLYLRKIRAKQQEEDEKRRHLQQNKKTTKENVEIEKKNKYIITAKEMQQINDLKKQLAQQNSFLQRFKMMGISSRSKRAPFLTQQNVASPPPLT